MVRLSATLAVGLGAWVVSGQNLNEATNVAFDPDADVEYPVCSLPPYQTAEDSFVPTADMCEPNPPAITKEELFALAVEYAPVLFFHPLEIYSLANVSDTFADPALGKIYVHDPETDAKTLFSDTLSLETLFDVSKDQRGVYYSFEHELTPEYQAGAGFTDGLSNAPIYFNSFSSGENTWTFNYWFYYAYNGRVDLGIVSGFQGDPPFTPFQVNPYGTHEGDWESMSVVVCESETASQPLAIRFDNAAYSLQTDCTKGECTFYKDTNHPVGFVSLGQHSVYPQPSKNIFNIEFSLNDFNVPGDIYITENTLFKADDGTYKSFMPTEDNVVELLRPTQISADSPVSTYWMAYGGRWGNSTTADAVPEIPPFCLDSAQMSFLDQCPDSTLFETVIGLIGGDFIASAIGSTGVDQETADLLLKRTKSTYGPRMWSWFRAPGEIRTSPFYSLRSPDTDEEEFCTFLTDLDTPAPTPPPTPPPRAQATPTGPSSSGSHLLGRTVFWSALAVTGLAFLMI